MAYFNLPFSIRISNANPVDGDRYLIADDTARDALITDGRAYEGLLIYHQLSGVVYILHKLGETPAESEWYPLVSGTSGTSDHGSLSGLSDDDHPQYILANGTRGFTGTVSGVTPTLAQHLTRKDYVDTNISTLSGWVYNADYRKSEFVSSGTNRELAKDAPLRLNADGYVDATLISGIASSAHTHGEYALLDSSPIFTGRILASGLTVYAPSGYIRICPPVSDQNVPVSLDLFENTTDFGGGGYGFRLDYNPSSNLFEIWSTANTVTNRWLSMHRDTGILTASRGIVASGLTVSTTSSGVIKAYSTSLTSPVAGAIDLMKGPTGEFGVTGNYGFRWVYNGSNNNLELWSYYSDQEPDLRFTMNRDSGLARFPAYISGLTPLQPYHVTRKDYVDEQDALYSGWVDNAFYKKTEFIDTFNSTPDVPVKTGVVGYIDKNFIRWADVRHDTLSGLADDDHTQYILVDGTRGFTGVVSGVTPTLSYHLADKYYVDYQDGILGTNIFIGINALLTNYVNRTGTNYFTGPVSGITPTVSGHLATKGYVDSQDILYSGTLTAWVQTNYFASADFKDAWNGNKGIPIITDKDGWIDEKFINWADVDHGSLGGLADDDHTIYVRTNASRGFTAAISGVTATLPHHLVRKDYVDTISGWAKSYADASDALNLPLAGGTMTGDINMDSQTVYFTVKDNGSITNTTHNIDWSSGHKQKIVINGSNIVTFTDPPGACNLMVIITQGSASATIGSWPTIKWVNSTMPTLSTSSGAVDIISFLFDGTNYYGMGSLNFG